VCLAFLKVAPGNKVTLFIPPPEAAAKASAEAVGTAPSNSFAKISLAKDLQVSA
jgi:hypothetical protein